MKKNIRAALILAAAAVIAAGGCTSKESADATEKENAEVTETSAGDAAAEADGETEAKDGSDDSAESSEASKGAETDVSDASEAAEQSEASGASDTGSTAEVDYSEEENWAYLGGDEETKADVFFICPTVYMGEEDSYNMPLDDEDIKYSFTGAINMEKGIYDDECSFYAPYYRQAALSVYELSEEEGSQYFDIAYDDLSDAFSYYLEEYNDGRPIILAGFSQGADMCIRLMKEYFDDEALKDQLVACYAIGWRLTEDEVNEYPQLIPASGEEDTGVIVAFNSEAEAITDSLMIPEGVKTYAINPLNWMTDGTPADKSLNKGACFTDYSGEIVTEIPELTGAYIDDIRGALKVTDVTPEEDPAGLNIFVDGIYHLYDYQFFYRNLEENVAARLNAYAGK